MRTYEDMEIYHQENPQMYEAFKRFTFQVIESGRPYFSASGIMERIRWYTLIESRSADSFKVNENIKPFYARKFEMDYPEHKGFFRQRRSVADKLKTDPSSSV